MNRFTSAALPWLAAWFLPSAVLSWILWASGQNPAAALPWGWIGAAGAAGYVSANAFLSWRRNRQFDEELAAHFLSVPRDVVATGGDIEITHEGWDRLIQDIHRDEARRRDE